MASLGELFLTLGFEVNAAQLDAFKQKLRDTHEEMNGLAKVTAEAVGVISGAFFATEKFVRKGADFSTGLSNMALQWNVNTNAVQTFANALHVLNSKISLEGAQGQYAQFARLIYAGLPLGDSAAGPLALLGGGYKPGTGQTPDQVFNNLAANYKAMKANPVYGPAYSSLLEKVPGLGGTEALIKFKSEHPQADYDAFGQYNTGPEALGKLRTVSIELGELDDAWHKFSTDMQADIAPKLGEAVKILISTLNALDAFNNAHPGAATAEFAVGGAGATAAAWKLLKGFFTGGAAGGAAEAGNLLKGGLQGLFIAGMAEAGWLGGQWIGNELKGNAGGATRGLRNNNPGNIKFGPFAEMHGAIGADSNGFAIFPSASMGTSAIPSLLKSYSGQHIDTIHGIVGRYTRGDSPVTQAGYEKMLEGMTGRKGSDHLNLSDPQVLSQLVAGIVRQENGAKSIVINVHSNAKDNNEVAKLVADHFQNQILNPANAQTNLGF